LRQALSADEIGFLKELSADGVGPGQRISSGHPLFDAVARADFNKIIREIWGAMRPARMLCFDKDINRNWNVSWHQDRVIEVDSKFAAPGYMNWSKKPGSWHCEPPLEILKSMLFLRLHLDDQVIDNGAMEIALGSHRYGKIAAETAHSVAKRCEIEVTKAEPGDILILSMLMLHRSLPSKNGKDRRVLRVDYAPVEGYSVT